MVLVYALSALLGGLSTAIALNEYSAIVMFVGAQLGGSLATFATAIFFGRHALRRAPQHFDHCAGTARAILQPTWIAQAYAP
jgi:hypothetical protein